MTDHHAKDNSSHGVGVGHEASELKIGPVVWFVIGLSVATIVIGLLVAGLFSTLGKREESSSASPSPLAGERQKLPPEPRLQLAPSTVEQLEGNKPPNLKQDHPLQEMKRLRAEEERTLNSYGWVDEKAGTVRIPIDEAKKRLLEKGIPTRQK
jgi:flagellar biosynthesis/type III secretory pathway M-ring protein FliF/YscJ